MIIISLSGMGFFPREMRRGGSGDNTAYHEGKVVRVVLGVCSSSKK